MKDVFRDCAMDARECFCCSADKMPVEIKYDAVFSNSVFSYFPDYEYAARVLNLMMVKTNHSIGLIDIHDEEKKDAFIEYRIKNVKDYEKRYKGLPKVFYPKDYFINFAKRNGLKIKFKSSDVEGYWNNDFVFNCYMYK